MENDDDDNIIVVVVGDGDELEFTGNSSQMCHPIPVKEEPLDGSDVMKIIATAEKYGRSIKIEYEDETYILPDQGPYTDDITFENAIKNIKEEIHTKNENINIENVEENQSAYYGFQDEDYFNEFEYEALDEDLDEEVYQISNDHAYDSDEYSYTEQIQKPSFRNRRKMLSPSLQKSFIDDLRQQYPELRKNEKALIKSLVEIMRNCKPPEPPRGFCIMNDVKFECVKCGTMSACLPAAMRHYQEKHGPRYLVCFACGVDFRSKTNLYKHEKRCLAPDAVIALKARAMYLGRKARSRPFIPDMHTVPLLKPKNNKRFPCTECSATFVTRTNLIAHENMHYGVRPFCCDQCPRAYTSLSALTRHLKIHSDEQYICDHCKTSFKIKAALVAHLDTHQAIKKHLCNLCGARYATKNALNHHVRRVHLQLPLPCACVVCPKRYPRMSLLRDHMKKKHGMSLMTRKMFFKALPNLTEAQLQQAKDILKADAPIINLSADLAAWVQT